MSEFKELFQENISKTDFDGVIDKIVSTYEEKIKSFESNKPNEQSDEEKALEERIKMIESKEQHYKLVDALAENKLPSQLAKYLKADDLENLGELNQVINDFVLDGSHKPNNHKKTETSVTKEQFKKMNYTDREKLYKDNEELYKKLSV